jgi:hypothetical protein
MKDSGGAATTGATGGGNDRGGAETTGAGMKDNSGAETTGAATGRKDSGGAATTGAGRKDSGEELVGNTLESDDTFLFFPFCCFTSFLNPDSCFIQSSFVFFST